MDENSTTAHEKPGQQEAGKLADEYILWGAGRAATIALTPLPLADVGPLMANEAFMIYRIGQAYGYVADQSMVAMLTGVMGASFAGKLAAKFIPSLKVPIAAGITFAVGKTAKVYFASGMTLDKEAMKQEFASACKEAVNMEWNASKTEESGHA